MYTAIFQNTVVNYPIREKYDRLRLYTESVTIDLGTQQPPVHLNISTSQQNFLHFEPSAIRHPTRLNFHQPFVHFEPQAMANRPVTNYPHPSFSNSGQQYLYSEIYDEEDTNE